MYPEDISKEEVAQLPKLAFGGEIVVVQTQAELNQWLPVLIQEKILGFDTETKPNFKKGEFNGIALLQLSSSKLALIIRMKEIGLPNELQNLLENPSILKIGAAIRDDLKALQKIRNFIPGGFIELQSVVPQYGIASLSVRKLSAIVLGHKVSKTQQLSNWESPTLTEAQKQYAATDAWACREIYLKLITSKVKK